MSRTQDLRELYVSLQQGGKVVPCRVFGSQRREIAVRSFFGREEHRADVKAKARSPAPKCLAELDCDAAVVNIAVGPEDCVAAM